MFRLGNTEIHAITDIDRFEIGIADLLPGMEKKLAGITEPGIASLILPENRIALTIRSWLIRREDRVILIDSCVGNHKPRPARPAWHHREATQWLGELRALGIRPEDVDIVMCTHLHADHVGWNTKLENGAWVPTFPNARYLTGRIEYEHALADSRKDANANHGAFDDSVAPVVAAGQMHFLDDGNEIARGLSVELAPGHTPGQLMLQARGQAQGGDNGAAVFCGDMIHSPLQLRFPGISSAFCADPETAARTRKAVLARLADSGDVLFPAHFPAPGMCRIASAPEGFRALAV